MPGNTCRASDAQLLYLKRDGVTRDGEKGHAYTHIIVVSVTDDGKILNIGVITSPMGSVIVRANWSPVSSGIGARSKSPAS